MSLELTDSGFDSSVLSEFCSRLIGASAEELLLDVLLQKCKERNWLKAKGRQRSDSTHVLGGIRAVNRVVSVGETMRAALNTLAVVAPKWVQKHSEPEWVKPYGRRIEASRLPESKEKREVYIEQIGMDGHNLLTAIFEGESSLRLSTIPVVDTLWQTWLQQYWMESGEVYWRTEKKGLPPSAQFISSPYDTDAHYACKYTTSRVGYKVHLTETCEEDTTFTNVATTSGPVADGDATQPIHESLQKKDLLLATLLDLTLRVIGPVVDTGYLDAKLLMDSRQDYGVDLCGPTRPDYRWQVQAKEGFAAEFFRYDWQQQEAICPEGKISTSWCPIPLQVG